MARYALSAELEGRFDRVKDDVTRALLEQGFGILTTIDVQATLRQKLGAEIERYEILGACNPGFAQRALAADRSIGLLLPCNVVLREVGGRIEVSIADPVSMFEIVDESTRAALAGLVADVSERLRAALATLAGADARG
jgi:uncharacterized protein (DUF302 family)